MSKLKDIFKKINDEILLLPDFQRDYKWGMEKQRNLLSSLLLKFPIGSSLTLNGKSTDFAARKIGELKQTNQEEEFECEYLLDGQQRTTTLYNALNNTYCINDTVLKFTELTPDTEEQCKKELKSLLSKKANSIKVRWFLKLPDGSDSTNAISDLFGAKKLKFDSKAIDEYEPEDITEIIKEQRFDEKNTGVTKWYSPFYEISFLHRGKSQKQFATDFVENCASEGLLPLFLIGESTDNIKNRIITRVLEKIASKNSQAIKDHINDDFSKVEKYDIDGVFDEFDNMNQIKEAGADFNVLLDKVFESLEKTWVSDVYNYLLNDLYNDYELLSIKTNDIRRAIPIFCHLNEGGMKLDDFDLLAARAAKKEEGDTEPYSLSEVVRSIMVDKLALSDPLKYETNSSGFLDLKNFDSIEDGLPTSYVKSAILAVCSLLAHGKANQFFENSPIELTKDKAKSKALLSLSTMQIRDNIEIAVKAVLRALAFLTIRCGIYNAKKLHYTLMVQPIAFAFTKDEHWNTKESLDRIECWYWSSLFSGAYLYDQSTVVIQDINSLFRWLEGGGDKVIAARKAKVFEDSDYSSKALLTMQGGEPPREGIRLAILQFVLSKDPYDLISEGVARLRSYDVDENTKDVHFIGANLIHDHHLIPLDIRKGLGATSEKVRNDPGHILNSPLNRVYISADANGKIGSLDPIRYFKYLGEAGAYKSNILSSNQIPDNFTEINTESCDDDKVLEVIEKRFAMITEAVGSRLLELKTN
ncbi:DUF262 domain-containing protein [Alkalimarinus alittae]|uniref:DUF262 domain-containing protein n=1 Tax=Alkalimarinus alittae TaxID=2961619 RepID=A0ABY6N412_9ALTE|nr:DUF262 domain-containing protein [Alkalimarinus alittae]UZE96824.1 DUF262 domain-containing protein [Alkalimarinus alittae]